MATLAGLPGVKETLETNGYQDSVTGFLNALKSQRAATGAGDHGSVTVWIDDDGQFRCAFTRFCSIVNTQIFEHKKQIKAWLTEWLPQMN